ncbi:MAG: hypothetical protein KBE42_00130 [Steroidobacteraceae bacterium]|nr:hypothetical protein [Steroidobacteraceae bacterium]
MRKTFLAAMGVVCGFAWAHAPAQNLQMADAPETRARAATPSRGTSMAQVERQFGAPAERFAAVGQPPITRWVYPDFVVFFEYSHVIHAVATTAAASQ